MRKKARLIAFYLPQFHPIPENDRWWGPGFTEWTNVAKAKPLFSGHYQPRVPADLGFYDLRVPEVREAQATMARQAGIEGFCYWHYWFAGKRILERPFNEVLQSGEPDFPFCLGWANETWTGIWHGAPNRVLIEQTYPGVDDFERHFHAVLPAFLDPRYIRVNGKPLFLVYRPQKLPDPEKFVEQWQKLAIRNGLPGVHFVAHLLRIEPGYEPWRKGFDRAAICNALRVCRVTKRDLTKARLGKAKSDKSGGLLNQLQSDSAALYLRAQTLLRVSRGQPRLVFDYKDAMPFFSMDLDDPSVQPYVYPCAIPNWDNSPRSGGRAGILHNSTPELFRTHLRDVLRRSEALPATERIVFVKSWNEWAEGNHLEPDLKYGHKYLDVLREEVFEKSPAKASEPLHA